MENEFHSTLPEDRSERIIEKSIRVIKGKKYNVTFIHNTPSDEALKNLAKLLIKM